MRRNGHHDAAVALLTSTALDLGADSGNPPPELLATYGSLLCTASYTAAQHGHRGRALEPNARRGSAWTPRGPGTASAIPAGVCTPFSPRRTPRPKSSAAPPSVRSWQHSSTAQDRLRPGCANLPAAVAFTPEPRPAHQAGIGFVPAATSAVRSAAWGRPPVPPSPWRHPRGS